VRIEGGLDPLADQIVPAAGAVQVDVMQDTGAGLRPRGDLGGLIVFAVAGEPSSRVRSPSRAARMMCGFTEPDRIRIVKR